MDMMNFNDYQKINRNCKKCTLDIDECDYCENYLDIRDIEVTCPKCDTIMSWRDEYNKSKTDDYVCLYCGFNKEK